MEDLIIYDGSCNYYNCIYLYVNNINGKKYVGQTVNLSDRYKQHKYDSFNPKREDYTRPLHNAIRKYGLDSFNVYILKHNLKNQDELNYWECKYISEYDTLVINNKGYNISEGGSNGNPLRGKTREELDEIYKKRSLAMLGENNPFYGKTHTQESIDKIRQANIGLKRQPVTEETRKKLASCRGKGKVGQYSLTGELIAIWDYISQASRMTGVTRCNISRCCNGGSKTAGGYIWKYIENE